MKVKLEWLNELVDLSGISVDEIVEKVSLYAIEIESVSKVINASNIVIGHVLTKEKHPNADTLSLLTVDVGNTVLQIVCGAPNVAAGQYVIVALVGATLPGNVKISKSKIRGVESQGMVCSLQELGIDKKYIGEKYSDGIYYFDEPKELGMPGDLALNLADEVIELGITPNRGDLLSMIGVAYELSAVFNRPLKPLVYKLSNKVILGKDKINVKIETEDCLTYYAQVIKNVKIGPSPTWLISRLIAFGVRPINNLVDITNYILALFGQPLHAFDYNRLGNHIVIRNAYKDEKITILDGTIKELLDTDIVITDGKIPVVLAGVMGGLDTEITNQTKDIVIEAAVFNPMTIRKTSSRLGLRSESSYRYERGVDINRTKQALDYACYLYQTLAGGEISNIAFDGIDSIPDKKIAITPIQVERLLGIKISKDDIKRILSSLNFKVDNDLNVFVPNRRNDITIEEDLIEEIGRLYGYSNLLATYPIDNMVGQLTVSQKKNRDIRATLSNIGLNETVTYSLVSEDQIKKFSLNHIVNAKPITLLMPISLERKYLRLGLIPSLLEVMKYNFSRKNTNLSIFEISKIYYSLNDENQEKIFLGGALSGEFSITSWKQNPEIVDFYLVKGILQTLFKKLNVEVEYLPMPEKVDELHPNRTAIINYNDKQIGFVGQLHPQFAMENDLTDVYVFEIDITEILNLPIETKAFTPIPKLPYVQRDISIVISKDILAIDIVNSIKKSEKKVLADVTVFDVYTGNNVGENEKSLALNLTFINDGTLTDELINSKVKKILKDLSFKFKATLRS